MPPSNPHLVPSRPVLHLSTPSGWLNDPNGLCYRNGTWHAFYQHDPTTNVHGTMHWGHATSTDLRRWDHHSVALAPDELGEIFSGSIVIDHDGTAGFGAGSMVAVFTHHQQQSERQSIAHSRDGGMVWTKYSDNPVLESDAVDFRDPKVIPFPVGGRAGWLMCVAAGQRIEFHRSTDLRTWDRTGEYVAGFSGAGPLECPDLLPLRDGSGRWLLMFGAVGVGPHGHSGTVGVVGTFDGRTFVPAGPLTRLDQGPDYYAAQTFAGAPGGEHIALAWLDSWIYATTHPSTDWRGVLSLPRRLEVDQVEGVPIVRSSPAVDVAHGADPVGTSSWTSAPDRALHVTTDGDAELTITGEAAVPVATVRIADGRIRLTRHDSVVPRFAETYEAPIITEGNHEIVVDHGTIEVFGGAGSTTLSALVFPGERWTVEVDGDATLRSIRA